MKKLIVISLILAGCNSTDNKRVERIKFTPPLGETTTLSNSNYSKLSNLKIEWSTNNEIELKAIISNANCGLNITTIASRKDHYGTFHFDNTVPFDSIVFQKADSCQLYINKEFDLSCELAADSILFN